MATSQNPHAVMVGARVAALLKAIYPRHRAKLIARDFGVSVPTAERWLAGHAPTVGHLGAMADRWSHRFIEVVFREAVAAHDRLRADDVVPPTWRQDGGRRWVMPWFAAEPARGIEPLTRAVEPHRSASELRRQATAH